MCVFVEETKILEKERMSGIILERSRKIPRITEEDEAEHEKASIQFWLDIDNDDRILKIWEEEKEPWAKKCPYLIRRT